MTITPLRNMVLVRLQNGTVPAHGFTIIQAEQVICRFVVMAIGPEVRDVKVWDFVLANRLAGTTIGDELLIPESAILAFLEPGPLPFVVQKTAMPWVISKDAL